MERLIGWIRREHLDHVIVLNKQHLRRILRSYVEYYHERTLLSLDRNSPMPSEVEPPERGGVIAIPRVGDLHHEYCRAAQRSSCLAKFSATTQDDGVVPQLLCIPIGWHPLSKPRSLAHAAEPRRFPVLHSESEPG